MRRKARHRESSLLGQGYVRVLVEEKVRCARRPAQWQYFAILANFSMLEEVLLETARGDEPGGGGAYSSTGKKGKHLFAQTRC